MKIDHGKKLAPQLAGAAPANLWCAKHGTFAGSILWIGDHMFPSRCVACSADEEHDADAVRALRVHKALEILNDLGEQAMPKFRKRKDSDVEFFVYLIDNDSKRRVSVGNFWANTPGEAVAFAEHTYPGLFDNLQTKRWQAEAERVTRPAALA
jgi:hypothetical protein